MELHVDSSNPNSKKQADINARMSVIKTFDGKIYAGTMSNRGGNIVITDQNDKNHSIPKATVKEVSYESKRIESYDYKTFSNEDIRPLALVSLIVKTPGKDRIVLARNKSLQAGKTELVIVGTNKRVSSKDIISYKPVEGKASDEIYEFKVHGRTVTGRVEAFRTGVKLRTEEGKYAGSYSESDIEFVGVKKFSPTFSYVDSDKLSDQEFWALEDKAYAANYIDFYADAEEYAADHGDEKKSEFQALKFTADQEVLVLDKNFQEFKAKVKLDANGKVKGFKEIGANYTLSTSDVYYIKSTNNTKLEYIQRAKPKNTTQDKFEFSAEEPAQPSITSKDKNEIWRVSSEDHDNAIDSGLESFFLRTHRINGHDSLFIYKSSTDAKTGIISYSTNPFVVATDDSAGIPYELEIEQASSMNFKFGKTINGKVFKIVSSTADQEWAQFYKEHKGAEAKNLVGKYFVAQQNSTGQGYVVSNQEVIKLIDKQIETEKAAKIAAATKAKELEKVKELEVKKAFDARTELNEGQRLSPELSYLVTKRDGTVFFIKNAQRPTKTTAFDVHNQMSYTRSVIKAKTVNNNSEVHIHSRNLIEAMPIGKVSSVKYTLKLQDGTEIAGYLTNQGDHILVADNYHKQLSKVTNNRIISIKITNNRNSEGKSQLSYNDSYISDSMAVHLQSKDGKRPMIGEDSYQLTLKQYIGSKKLKVTLNRNFVNLKADTENGEDTTHTYKITEAEDKSLIGRYVLLEPEKNGLRYLRAYLVNDDYKVLGESFNDKLYKGFHKYDERSKELIKGQGADPFSHDLSLNPQEQYLYYTADGQAFIANGLKPKNIKVSTYKNLNQSSKTDIASVKAISARISSLGADSSNHTVREGDLVFSLKQATETSFTVSYAKNKVVTGKLSIKGKDLIVSNDGKESKIKINTIKSIKPGANEFLMLGTNFTSSDAVFSRGFSISNIKSNSPPENSQISKKLIPQDDGTYHIILYSNGDNLAHSFTLEELNDTQALRTKGRVFKIIDSEDDKSLNEKFLIIPNKREAGAEFYLIKDQTDIRNDVSSFSINIGNIEAHENLQRVKIISKDGTIHDGTKLVTKENGEQAFITNPEGYKKNQNEISASEVAYYKVKNRYHEDAGFITGEPALLTLTDGRVVKASYQAEFKTKTKKNGLTEKVLDQYWLTEEGEIIEFTRSPDTVSVKFYERLYTPDNQITNTSLSEYSKDTLLSTVNPYLVVKQDGSIHIATASEPRSNTLSTISGAKGKISLKAGDGYMKLSKYGYITRNSFRVTLKDGRHYEGQISLSSIADDRISISQSVKGSEIGELRNIAEINLKNIQSIDTDLSNIYPDKFDPMIDMSKIMKDKNALSFGDDKPTTPSYGPELAPVANLTFNDGFETGTKLEWTNQTSPVNNLGGF